MDIVFPSTGVWRTRAYGEGIAMGVLLAHTHYSIDVFAVPFIVPTIYRLASTWQNGAAVAESPHRPLSAP